MKELVGAFNQENALVEAFSVIVKTDGSFAALLVRLGGGVRDTRTGRALSGSYADTLTTARHCMEPVTAQLTRVSV